MHCCTVSFIKSVHYDGDGQEHSAEIRGLGVGTLLAMLLQRENEEVFIVKDEKCKREK